MNCAPTELNASCLFYFPLVRVETVVPGSEALLLGQALSSTPADVAMLTAFVLLALGLSFICSIAEAVLLSITPSFIVRLREKRPKRAAMLKRLKQDDVDQALAAILTLNTIAHTVGAIGAGAKATAVFGSAWFGLFSAIMTLAILFLSEIIPKTIGAVYWARLAVPTAQFVRTLVVVLYPIVWISEKLTRLIAQGKKVHVFSRDEFAAMARVGEDLGEIRKGESRIIRNLLLFDSLSIPDIMTPRTVISALSEDESIEKAVLHVTKSPFSRLPLYRDHIDDITGMVLKDDILLYSAQEREKAALKDLNRDIMAVPESMSLLTLFEKLVKDRQHISIVVDEYGGTAGLVTLEDLIETMIGLEIVDETDTVKDMQLLARSRWVKRAKSLGEESPVERGKTEFKHEADSDEGEN